MAKKFTKKINKNAKKFNKKINKWEKKNPAAALALKVVPVAGGIAGKIYINKKIKDIEAQITPAQDNDPAPKKSIFGKIKGILPGKKETAPAPAPAPEGAQNNAA